MYTFIFSWSQTKPSVTTESLKSSFVWSQAIIYAHRSKWLRVLVIMEPTGTQFKFTSNFLCKIFSWKEVLWTFAINVKNFITDSSPKNLSTPMSWALANALYLPWDWPTEGTTFRVTANKHVEGWHQGCSSTTCHPLLLPPCSYCQGTTPEI